MHRHTLLVLLILTRFRELRTQSVAPGNNGSSEFSEEDDKSPSYPYVCVHPIFCRSLNITTFFFACSMHCSPKYSSEQYATLQLLAAPEEVQSVGRKLMESINSDFKSQVNVDRLDEFRDKYFAIGNEMESITPHDYQMQPGFLSDIVDLQVKTFAINVLTIWPSLSRRVKPTIKAGDDKHSVIYVPNPFLVCGNRSMDWRYFEMYWLLEGALVSRMRNTAQGMLANMAHLIEKYGYIPSGSRIYYLDRLSPPLFTKMVYLYYKHTGDIEWVRENIDQCIKELEYWQENRAIAVNSNGTVYNMYQYRVRSHGVRVENMRGDYLLTETVKDRRREFLNEIKSATESSWEFSSRWIFNDQAPGPDNRIGHIRFTNLTRVVPVDLSAIMCGSFFMLGSMLALIQRGPTSKIWLDKGDEMANAIMNIHWNDTDGIWYDYDVETSSQRAYFYASNVFPLWMAAFSNSSDATIKKFYGQKVASYLTEIEVTDYPGGVPTSLVRTDEDWDFPNSFAPLVEVIIQGLVSSTDENAMNLAAELYQKFVKSVHLGYLLSKEIHYSYDATNPGRPNTVFHNDRQQIQRTGYGWTNAVVLTLLRQYESEMGGAAIKTARNWIYCAAFYLALYTWM